MGETVWVLGDQLTLHDGPLAADPERVLMVESTGFADRREYHPRKLATVFAAMRHLRDHLRSDGVEVVYERTETFDDALDAFFDEHPEETLIVQRPASHGSTGRLRELVADRGGSLETVANAKFRCSPETFDEWYEEAERSGSSDGYDHEAFYRFMRRRTGDLMDGDDPEGGEWNYDAQNRETPPADYEPPNPPQFEPDEITREVREAVQEQYGDNWGRLDEPQRWPVTHAQAEAMLEDFVVNRLADFGPYQDALVEGEWALDHSLLSPALNLGLLDPAAVVERAILEYRERDDIPINSVEGFVRQVDGWREFVRHVYRREMPGLARANQLGHDRELPPLYRDPDATDMTCLSEAVAHVRDRGYAHHIERLMVLSNFALTAGVSPQAVNDWFHASFVDAFHWVATPNVLGMGLYATDSLATKPYASSANYVDEMSDYCTECAYDPDETTGDGACPFNALYWDFLDRHEERLRSNPRIAAVYGHWDDRDESEREVVRERAAEVRERAEGGDL